MLNVIAITGRLTADPEIKYVNEIPVINFTVAVDRNYVKLGEERKADFIDCVGWRGKAEFISKYFGKGDMITVQGELQTDNYMDKEGNKRKAYNVVVDTVSFCGSKRNQTNVTGEYMEICDEEFFD